MIELEHLSKRYGPQRAVDDVSLTIAPGTVTALLGPNGAGKSTTLRMICGLSAPTAGHSRVLGVPYRATDRPLRRIGALLDPLAAYPGRRINDHLRATARASGIPPRRVPEALAVVGLADEGRRRLGTCSLGMRQRVGLAAALLGEPEVLILDEPLNGLDSGGIRWLRSFLREQADGGCTVLLSSHAMQETQAVADRVVIIDRGRLVADLTSGDLSGRSLEDLYVDLVGEGAAA